MIKAIRQAKNLSLIFVETPANPTLRMSDIAAASEAAGAHADQPLVAVDNTLMGPTFQHPLTLGADLAVYSATKYLSGFSDMLAGVIRGKDPEIIQELRNVRNSSGVVGGAGVKTASHMDALWELLQAARTSENRIKTKNRVALRIQHQNQRIQGRNCANRSTRIRACPMDSPIFQSE